ncbi:MAG TPA: hypothetical protein DEP46_05640, partial [Blastocatellia bacterium]|nr:hypothetical protein [Blastocatellia bacterium]
MRRKLFLFVALFSLLAFNLTPVSADGGIEIGQKMENFTLTGIDGKEHSLSGLMGKNGAVLVWVSA